MNSDDAPVFDAGSFLQVGPPGSKVDIDIGSRATPVVVDWNDDGLLDLVLVNQLRDDHLWPSALFQQREDHSFENVSQRAGFDLQQNSFLTQS